MAQLIWTRRGLTSFERQLEYWEPKISTKSLLRLIDKVEQTVERIAAQPGRGVKSLRFKTVRRMTVDSKMHLYYRTHGQRVIIVFCYGVRQNPENNPYE